MLRASGFPVIWRRLAFFLPPLAYIRLVQSHPAFWRAAQRAKLSPKQHLDDAIMFQLARAMGGPDIAQEFLDLVQASPDRCVITGGFLLGVLNGHEFGDIDIAVECGNMYQDFKLTSALKRWARTGVLCTTRNRKGQLVHHKCVQMSLQFYLKKAVAGNIKTFRVNKMITVQLIPVRDAAEWITEFDMDFLKNAYDTRRLCVAARAFSKECELDFKAMFVDRIYEPLLCNQAHMNTAYERLLKYRKRGYHVRLQNICLRLPESLCDAEDRSLWYEFWSARISEKGEFLN